MKKKRRNHSPEFKAKVGLEAPEAQQTAAELARKFEVHVSQVGLWKSTIKEGLPGLFEVPGGGQQSGLQEICRACDCGTGAEVFLAEQTDTSLALLLFL